MKSVKDTDDLRDDRTNAIVSAIFDIIETIKVSSPLISQQLETYRQQLVSIHESFDSEKRELLLSGQGPAATTLRHLKSVIRKPNIEQIIKDSAPVYFNYQTTTLTDFRKKVDLHLRSFVNSGLSDRVWLPQRKDSEYKGVYEIPFLDAITEDVKPGFHRYRFRDEYSHSSAKIGWFFALHLERVVLICPEFDNHFCFVHVPIEDCWVKSYDMNYVNLIECEHRFEDLLAEEKLEPALKLDFKSFAEAIYKCCEDNLLTALEYKPDASDGVHKDKDSVVVKYYKHQQHGVTKLVFSYENNKDCIELELGEIDKDGAVSFYVSQELHPFAILFHHKPKYFGYGIPVAINSFDDLSYPERVQLLELFTKGIEYICGYRTEI